MALDRDEFAHRRPVLPSGPGRRERDPFTFLLVVMIAYLLITALSGWALKRAEKRLSRGY